MLSSVVLAQILLPLALGNVIQDHRVLYERANAAVPEATPTGPFCGGGATASATVPSASELASAIAGCNGIAPAGATRNDILDGICKPFTLLFARGTTEQGKQKRREECFSMCPLQTSASYYISSIVCPLRSSRQLLTVLFVNREHWQYRRYVSFVIFINIALGNSRLYRRSAFCCCSRISFWSEQCRCARSE